MRAGYWRTVVRLLAIRHRAVAQRLIDTAAIGPVNGVVTVEVASEADRRALEAGIDRMVLEKAVQIVYGEPVRVRFVTSAPLRGAA